MKRKSFTLIEVIMVVAVIGLVLPIFFSIIFSILRQRIKIQALQEVKKQGDSISQTISQTIKNNAVKIYNSALTEQCITPGVPYSSTVGADFIFTDKNNNNFYIYIYLDTNITYIASSSSILDAGSVDLSDNIVNASNFSISCNRTALYSPPVVKVNFTLQYKDETSLSYQTRVKLRSY